MQIDLRPAAAAAASLDAAGRVMGEAADLKVGLLFHRSRRLDVVRLLDEAVTHVQSARDALQGAGAVQPAARVDESLTVVRGAADAARDGARKSARSTEFATAHAALATVATDVRAAADAPTEAAAAQAWAVQRAVAATTAGESALQDVARDFADLGTVRPRLVADTPVLASGSFTGAWGPTVHRDVARVAAAAVPDADVVPTVADLLAKGSPATAGERYHLAALADRVTTDVDRATLDGLRRTLASETPAADEALTLDVAGRALRMAVDGTASAKVGAIGASSSLGPLAESELRDLLAASTLTGPAVPARPYLAASYLRSALAEGDLEGARTSVAGPLAALGPLAGVASPEQATTVLERAARDAAAVDDPALRNLFAHGALLPDHLRPGLTGGPEALRELQAGATKVVAGTDPGATWPGYGTIDRLFARQRYTQAGSAATRASELLAGDVRAIDAAGMRELRGIDALPEGLRPAWLPTGLDYGAQLALRAAKVRTRELAWAGWEPLLAAQAQLRFPSESAADDVARNLLLTTAPNERTPAQWRELAAVARRRPDGLAGLRPADFDGVAAAIEAKSQPHVSWPGWTALDAAAATARYPTPEAATAGFGRLLERSPFTWTPADWHDLEGLNQLPEGLRPADLPVGHGYSAIGNQVAAGGAINLQWNGLGPMSLAAMNRRVPDAAAARALVLGHLDKGIDGMAAADWHDLALAEERLASTKLPDGVTTMTTGVNARELLGASELVRTNQPFRAGWTGWGALATYRAASRYPTQAAATARTLELLDTPTLTALDADRLDELHGILNLPDGIRPAGLAKNAQFSPLARTLGQGGTPARSVGGPTLAALDTWQFRNGIGRARVLAGALERVRGGTALQDVHDVDGERAAELVGAANEDLLLLDQLKVQAAAGEVYHGADIHYTAMQSLAANALQRLRLAEPRLGEMDPDLAEQATASIAQLDAQVQALGKLATIAEHNSTVSTTPNTQVAQALAKLEDVRVGVSTLHGALDEQQRFAREIAESAASFSATGS